MINGFNSMEAEKIIEKTNDKVSMILEVRESNPYFSGHFPGFPVFPAVAQMELVIRFGSRYLGTGTAVSMIKRIKFVNPIHPPLSILLLIEKQNNAINFNISSSSGGTVYSMGTVIPHSLSEVM